jgi:HAD superfamily hydrolase (TIGR01509 family)
MMKIQAIVFDLDGLMVDSEPMSMKAWQKLLTEFGHSLEEKDYPSLIGIDGDSTIKLLRQKMDIPLKNREIMDLHDRYWIAIVREEVQPVSGLFDLVKAFKSRDYKLGVASNSRSEYVHAVLDTIELKENFHCVLSADQVQRGKPAPDIYQAAAACLGVEPEVCLALEDSPTGLKSALAAGMRCIVVPNQKLLHESYAGAYAHFPSLLHLYDNLDQVLY